MLKKLKFMDLYKLLVVVCLSIIVISLAFDGEKSEEMNNFTISLFQLEVCFFRIYL